MQNLLLDLSGFLIRSLALVGIVFLVSRLRPVRATLHSGKGLLFVLLWGGAAWLAPNLTICSGYVAFFAGRYAGSGAGTAVGLVAALRLAVGGQSALAQCVQPLAGWLGGRLGASPGFVRLAVVAGALSVLGMDPPDHPGSWLPLHALEDGPSGFVQLGYLWLGFSLGSGLFYRGLEYVVHQPDRDRALAADRVLGLVEHTGQALEQGLTPASGAELAPRLRQALEVAGLYLARDGKLLGFSGPRAHAHGLESCPVDCPYTGSLQVALPDATLVLLSSRREPFQTWTQSQAQAVGAMLSSCLHQRLAALQQQALDRARFDFLQAQIQPHFLFNTLNSLAALCSREPARCRQLALELADFLRHSFQRGKQEVPLAEELDVVRLYLNIEQVRFGGRLQVHWELSEPLPLCTLPVFSLQPLVENAVRHGLSPRVEGGSLWIRVTGQDGAVQIEIEDDGVGMEHPAPQPGSGIGLNSVRQRLQGRGRLEVYSNPDGTKICIEVPGDGL